MRRGQREFQAGAEYTIGVDESGTGAFAGPFTVCAFMSASRDTQAIRKAGATDSKVLTHRRRVKLCAELAAFSVRSQIIEVPHDYTEQRKAWREAVAQAVKHCLEYLDWDTTRVKVVIDGAEDQSLRGYFNRIWSLNVNFVPRADATVPQVSAASIFAKTRRTEIMKELSETYPHYRWHFGDGEGNAGYGTEDHLALIKKHGICALHRRVRPLLPYFDSGGDSATQACATDSHVQL